MKALFHFHSNFSYDGLNSVERIIRFIVRNDIDTVVLTDHDNIEGSRKLTCTLARANINCKVVPAVEYRTDYGDIILAGYDELLIRPKFSELLRVRENQNDVYLILPHPYDGHRDVNYLAQNVDIIEVFNSRTKPLKNQMSNALAIRFHKPVIWASDSHIPSTLGNVILEYNEELLADCINGEVIPSVIRYSKYDMWLSQMKKAIVHKNMYLLILLLMQPVFFFKRKIFR